MTDPGVMSDAALEEMTAVVVPCGGVFWPPPGHVCPASRAAVVRLTGGCCFSGSISKPSNYKCIPCYTEWLESVMQTIAEHGSVVCYVCQKRHKTPEGLAWYASF